MSVKRKFPEPTNEYSELHRRVYEELKNMTREEFLASTVRVGIHTPDGKLTPFYAKTIPSRPSKRKAAAKRKAAPKRKAAQKTKRIARRPAGAR